MAKYYDADGYPARPTNLLKLLTCLCVIALAFVAVVTQWQTLRAYLPTPGPIILIATPAADTAPRLPAAPARPAGPISAPASVPSQIDAYNATATAQYQEAIRAAQPVENTGQGAPVVLSSKPADARQPAGENVPTAEPVAHADSGSAFGSKPVLINPQATHECKHGQVWTENGCKNP